jgi:glycerophosphoryl diester phosphodiesterase
MVEERLPRFNVQGHRGARGLKPENTLPAFEVAFDLGVTSVETDVHLSRDGVPVIIHDPDINECLCRLIPGAAAWVYVSRSVEASAKRKPAPLISSLTLAQLRGYRAVCNPDPARFPHQDASVTPLAARFAERAGIDPFTPPTLADLFAFAAAYAGELGDQAGKTEAQRAWAGQVIFDLELKRVPFRPELIGDGFDGGEAARLERQVVACIQSAGVLERTVVRSFDHRAVRAIGRLEPRLTTAVLVAGTAPASPAEVARAAGACLYCPDFEFLDQAQVSLAHAAGITVLPLTVNEPCAWERLLAWGVDGITTDYPDRLLTFLRDRALEGGRRKEEG